jgi:alpha-amylase/alpha-mannosidase (GH57 family)
MPWVRLHALKDYLDMPLRLSDYDNTRATFNLVPALIDQLDLYQRGGTDPHLELSRIPADQLSQSQRTEILKTFFSANPQRMIKPYDRFHRLHQKATTNYNDRVLPALFASEELRDIQVWSNLVWVDPRFRTEEPIRSLFAKGKHFTEREKQQLLDWQIELISRIVPSYRKLFEAGTIDISFTPYYHPILPLLCDTNSALEASPQIALPRRRFQHPEDAQAQIRMAREKFESLFARPLRGMWPSEGSVSEQVAELMIQQQVQWIASDEDVLYQSMVKAGRPERGHLLHTVYNYRKTLSLFFRDRALSDRIGFVYSEWDADKAVADFIGHLRRIRELLAADLEHAVVPVILDGENAWEYFENDGEDFLKLLYDQLEEDSAFETVTMTEAADQLPGRDLPRLFSGSWINHNFRIWIGHPEDNTAWDLLSAAREALVKFQSENPDFDQARLQQAWRQIYIAEGSDWCWWYGDEHRGAHNAQFDRTYRRHLVAVYELLGLEIPVALLNPVHHGTEVPLAELPETLVTPELDGRVTHFYEWAGAGVYNCEVAGGAMHRGDRMLASINFGYDHEWLYIRLDFTNAATVRFHKGTGFRIDLYVPEHRDVTVELTGDSLNIVGKMKARAEFDSVLELAVLRADLWEEGHGELGFTVSALADGQPLETWPDNESIQLTVPKPDSELFWPM